MKYNLLGNEVILSFTGIKKDYSDKKNDFDHCKRSFYISSEVNDILRFKNNEHKDLNIRLFHNDIIKRYKEKAQKTDLFMQQTLMINNYYCTLIDDGSKIILMSDDILLTK